MLKQRVVATVASAAAVLAVGGVVVGMVGAQPTGRVDAIPSLQTSGAAPTPSTDRTYPIGTPTSATATPTTSAAPSTSAATSTASVSAAARPATTAQAQAQAPAPAAAPAPVRGQALPVGYDTGDATQVVTVTAPSTGSTYAKLSWWSKAPGGGWLRVGGPVTARVGDQGMTTNAHEGYDGTPMGGFTLTQAFGWAGNPGTGLPYITTDSNSWWIGHQGSTYNSYQHCSGCAAESQGDEHLSTVDVYRYAVVIDYNRFPAVYPRGSAFFLHIMNSQATAGCVSTDVNSLVSVMRWLNLGNHPRILIGVGQGG